MHGRQPVAERLMTDVSVGIVRIRLPVLMRSGDVLYRCQIPCRAVLMADRQSVGAGPAQPDPGFPAPLAQLPSQKNKHE